jgi:hypothetical protein
MLELFFLTEVNLNKLILQVSLRAITDSQCLHNTLKIIQVQDSL